MGKVVYRKEKKSRSPYPLLILGAVVVFGFSLVNLVFPKRDMRNWKTARPRSCRRSAFRHCWTAAGRAGLPAGCRISLPCVMSGSTPSARRTKSFSRKSRRAASCWARTTGCLRSSLPWTMPPRSSLLRTCRLSALLRQAHPGKVTFLLAPSASVIYPEELPTGAPMADENAMLDDIFTTVGQNASVLDLRPTFTADKNEYLYFKTAPPLDAQRRLPRV